MSQRAISTQYTGEPRISASFRTAVSRSGRLASWPMRCGATNRSIDTAASMPASAAVTPMTPPCVSTSTSVTRKERCTWPRPHAGRKSAGSGRSSTRERTRVIVVSVVEGPTWTLSIVQRPKLEAMSRGFRNADSTQAMSEQVTAGAIDEVLEREREEAAHAAERRAQGAYGICEDCGQEISPERLAILPSATRCVGCQASLEQSRQRHARTRPPPSGHSRDHEHGALAVQDE